MRSARHVLNQTDMLLIDPLLRVALAVLAQAAQDARTGGKALREDAAAWLVDEGALWVEVLGGDAEMVWAWIDAWPAWQEVA